MSQLTTSHEDPIHAPHAADHGPKFQTYITVFLVLCVCTGLSFLVNLLFGHGRSSSVAIIIGIAVVKATLVVLIFMHLKMDWNKLYCIVIPVCVMAVMMIIVLLPDIVYAWHHPEAETPIVQPER